MKIRSAEIRNKHDKLKKLRKQANQLGIEIEQDTCKPDDCLTYAERQLIIVLAKIATTEDKLKVMKGEMLPPHKKPWANHRAEQFITAYGAV